MAFCARGGRAGEAGLGGCGWFVEGYRAFCALDGTALEAVGAAGDAQAVAEVGTWGAG